MGIFMQSFAPSARNMSINRWLACVSVCKSEYDQRREKEKYFGFKSKVQSPLLTYFLVLPNARHFNFHKRYHEVYLLKITQTKLV